MLEMCVVIAFLLGLGIGLIFPHKSSGTIRIDHSNPEKDVYRLEVDDLESMDKKHTIVFKIDHNADLSQK